MGGVVDSHLPISDERSGGDTQVEEGGIHESAATSERESDREICARHILLLPTGPLGGWVTKRKGEMA
eukprot:5592166-Pyramimonas_sp.AAC.1